jgi:hypothetical protein
MVVGELHPDDIFPKVIRNRTKPSAGLDEDEAKEEAAKYRSASEASIMFEFLSWPLDYISVMTKLEHFPSVAISLIPYLSRKLKLKSLPTLTINYLIPLFKQAC